MEEFSGKAPSSVLTKIKGSEFDIKIDTLIGF
jgi:hypothetical protein